MSKLTIKELVNKFDLVLLLVLIIWIIEITVYGLNRRFRLTDILMKRR